MPQSITGYFPTHLGPDRGADFLRSVTPDQTVRWEWISPNALLSVFNGKCLKKMYEDTATLSGSGPSDWYGPFACTATGTPSPKIPSEVVELLNYKLQTKRKVFLEAIRTGEILFYPYAKGKVTYDYQRGWDEVVHTTTNRGRGVPYNHKYIREWLKEGDWYYRVPSVRLFYKYVTRTEGKTPFQLGFRKDTVNSAILASVQAPIDCSLVTKTYGDINKSTVDVLTALAEAKETARSAFSAIITVMRLYREARAKSFRLYNKARRGPNQVVDTALLNSKEFLNALSDIWLNFRYSIMPNVYLIEDVVDALTALRVTFVREASGRVVTHTPPSFEGWTVSGDIVAHHRNVIKRRIRDSNKAHFDRLYMANIAITAWELTPYSFVIDWFLNIGDVIASLLTFPTFEEEKSTYSVKSEYDLTYFHEATGARVKVTGQSYKMRVIEPRNYVGIHFEVDLNLKRSLDLLSLFWKNSRLSLLR